MILYDKQNQGTTLVMATKPFLNINLIKLLTLADVK